MTSQTRPNNDSILIRSVALPSEHGGWGFLSEPVVLGMIAAPTLWGLLFVISAIGGFLLHQPLKIAIKDRLKGKRPQRTIYAERFALLYGLIALVTFALVWLNNNPTFWIPLIIAAPFAFVQMYYDAQNKSRALIPELCGVIALGGIAPTVAILGGMPVMVALSLWLVLLARGLPAVTYVRARLKLEYGKLATPVPTLIFSGATLLIIGLLALIRVVPLIAAIGVLIFTLHAFYGLSRYRRPARPAVIGIQQMIFGLTYVVLCGLAY